MKVMHVIRDMGPGGAERVVLNYMKHMDRKYFVPILCVLCNATKTEREEIEAIGMTFHCLQKSMGWDTGALLTLAKIIRDEQVDILHLHNFPAQLYGTLAALITSRPAILRTEHNVVRENGSLLGLVKSHAKFMMGFFHRAIITVSDQVKESHLDHDRWFQSKYITIYNGIDVGSFQIEGDMKEYEAEFGFTRDQLIIGKVASMYPQKAHEDFFRAARIVSNEIPEARFLVIGDGPRRLELEKMVSELGLKQETLFTGLRDDIPRLLKFIDIFALSSAWEGFPMTILEAMASGKPVVVTDVGGNREAVVDGQTGLLVESGDPEGLANAITELGNDPKKRREMGTAGKARVEKYFTAQEMVRKTEQLYTRCWESN